jgi:chemosensory pili system protein ChpA (sensor histidine kinase/response regulator)
VAEAAEVHEPVFEAEPAPVAEPEPEPVARVEALRVTEEIAASAEDQVKVIGPLRIGIALYNVYLNEADEWSRQLATDVGEWSLESHERLPDSTIALAHSLAGSSATVGFHSLSGMARLLEAALQHLQMQGSGTREQGLVLVAAADELRRLLHQFAVGFLRDPAEGTLQALRDIAASPMPTELAMRAEARSLPQVVVHETIADVALDDSEDAIDVADAIDPDLFPIFEEEAAELMPLLGGALRLWAPRATHSARDGRCCARCTRSRAAPAWPARCAWANSRTAWNPPSRRCRRKAMAARSIRCCSASTRCRPTSTAAAPRRQPGRGARPANPAGHRGRSSPCPRRRGRAPGRAGRPPRRRARHVPAASQLVVPRAASNQAVRVRSQLLDRLMNQAGEVMITRSRLENELRSLRGSLNDLTGNLDRLRSQLRDIECRPSRRCSRAWRRPRKRPPASTRWNSTASRACRNSPA